MSTKRKKQKAPEGATAEVRAQPAAQEPTKASPEDVNRIVDAMKAANKASKEDPPLTTTRPGYVPYAVWEGIKGLPSATRDEIVESFKPRDHTVAPNIVDHAEARDADVAVRFMARYNERVTDAKTKGAFHEVFDLAAKLNESACALGIRSMTLNADTGDVTVTYKSRPDDQHAASAP